MHDLTATVRFRRRPLGFWLAVLGVWVLAGQPAAARDVTEATLRFKGTVRPFLETHCFECHGAEKRKGDVRFDRADGVIRGQEDADLWDRVLEQLVFGEMPPDSQERPPDNERGAVIEWLKRALGKRSNLERLMRLPGYGNYVDHEKLFTEPAVRKAASPARLWRISPHYFKDFVNDLAQKKLLVVKKNQGGDGMHPALPFLTPEHEFNDYAVSHGFEEATTELLMDMLWQVAGYQLDARRPAEGLRAPLEAGSPGEAEYKEAIRVQFDLVIQREPMGEELRRLVSLGLRTQGEAGTRVGVQTVLMAVLLSPEAVFRYETGGQTPDEHGRVRLEDREIGLAIALALTDRRMDPALREAVESGELATREGVERQVRRILDDDSIDKPRIVRFFQEYFEYTRAPDVFKTGRKIKHYLPRQMVDDADTLVRHVLVDGELLVEDGRPTRLDAGEIRREAERSRAAVLRRSGLG